ncbi:heavy metal translocating P-type ATPase [Paenibacillus sp. y28]|uniref:heavy metal translocating P-type ATPase n=1 Tax=Paenibacillus sp. y28 TaxID=3129110 RepID=UPI00301A2540
MMQYRVKGLSCGHCAAQMEEQIQKLAYGDTARLQYNSSKLLVDERVQLDEVEHILRREGARLVKPEGRTSAGSAACEAAAGQEQQEPRAMVRPLAMAGVHGSHEPSEADCCGHDDHGGADSSHDHQLRQGSAGYRAAEDRSEALHGHAHAHSYDEHGHDHDHEHNSGVLMKALLGTAAVLYLAAILLQDNASGALVIPLYLAAIASSGYTTFFKGIRNLMKLRFNMDTLMTIALIGAIGLGEWKEATLVAILFGVNEWLEGMGMERARRSMEALLQAAPKEAIRLAHGREEVVPVAQLQAGDIVLVRPGGQIPSDGVVISGRSSVSEAAITGEPLPVDKVTGDAVYGGSLNNEGVLQLRMTKAFEDSSLAKILHLVEEAQDTKTPTELFINRFSRYYTPVIMVIAVLVMVVPPLVLGGSWDTWLYQGLAVLIVGCPCALILSSPIAIISGITRSARMGILIKGGVHLEQLGHIDTLAFDKTGTLTKGEPKVEAAIVYDESRFYTVLRALEEGSSHPLAKAVLRYVEEQAAGKASADCADTSAFTDIRAVPGQGMIGFWNGVTVTVGNEQSAAGLQLPQEVRDDIARLKEQGMTLVAAACGGQVLGLLGIEDEIREESRGVIAALHRRGVRHTVMLTGDHPRTAERVARAVGVTDWQGGLLPEHKVEQVKKLAAAGRVAMVGDGMNDAPALASANLGIAMGKGTDSALETADVVLMQDHLGRLPDAIMIARRVNRIIKWNIGIALGLKIIALLLTIPGWLTLWIAILSDMGATILVTLLSLTVMLDFSRRDQA